MRARRTARHTRELRTTGRARLGLGSALLCVGWSFSPDDNATQRPVDATTLSALPSVGSGPPAIEIAPPESDASAIELDSTQTVPELPSAGDDGPQLLDDAAL